MLLEAGEQLYLTQQLGLSFTVQHQYNLFRIAGEDGDAIGLEPVILTFDDVQPGAVNEAHIWQVLCRCYDPEISLNIVDLGLVYKALTYIRDDGENVVEITMTLTAAGCGMGPILMKDIEAQLYKVPNVDIVQITLVFDPPWNKSMISAAGKLTLGLL